MIKIKVKRRVFGWVFKQDQAKGHTLKEVRNYKRKLFLCLPQKYAKTQAIF